MEAQQLRETFLKFFEARGHKIIAPSSLIPQNDPTVLFTTAGMHPLVSYLNGEKHPEGKRLCDVQPCLRTNDIDEVGDAVHLTFFEMLGNWSLGDYWKKEAINWSCELLVEKLRIPKERLAISCFAGDENSPKDEVSAEIWRFLGVPRTRIAFLPKENNWWGPAGQTGPCGPDTEVFIWTGGERIPDDFDPEDTNWVEILNDVFMQYNYHSSGTYGPSTQKNVDTGMGLERMLAILQNKKDIFETELFYPIIQAVENLSGNKYSGATRAFRIIADHIKAATFILSEGVIPSNKLQGYVARRLIRRAIVFAQHLGIVSNFTSKLSGIVVEIYQATYPRLAETSKFISEKMEKEENRFRKTIALGLKSFEKYAKSGDKLTGKLLFDFYQTCGFPLELSLEIAREKDLALADSAREDYKKEFQKHQELSRQGTDQQFKGGLADARLETTRLHSAAHLLHAALRQVLGTHVLQKGSNITAERLRFDFSHGAKLTDEQLQRVEDLVNEQIRENLPVKIEEMSIDEAKKSGALGVFDDRYENHVKVFTIGDFSREICGGPHAKSTGELGRFKITNESSSSAGIRRIKAVLG